MDRLSNTLFSVLKTALWKETLNMDVFISFTVDDWQQFYKLSAQQGVLAIIYDVVSRLPERCQPPRNIKLRWGLGVENIEKRYKIQLAGANKLCDIWDASGIRTVVLKGFSLSKYYPVPEHRECGDFDCYLLEGRYEDGNVLAEQNGAKVNREWYKHSQIYFRGMMAENHNFLVTTREGKSAKELNTILVDKLGGNLQPIENTKIFLPSPIFTALFVTYHSFSHFISEGITIRHLCDWACFMKAEQNNFDWNYFYELCKQFKFDRFVDASNEIITKFLNVELPNKSIICNSPYTQQVLDDILYGNSKVFNSNKGKWYKRIKLITNIFSYRWKHHDIARSSSLNYFLSIIFGFLFRKEKH